MSSLFNIDSEYLKLKVDIEESGGEVDDSIIDLTMDNEEDFKDKAKQYRYLIKAWEGEIETAKEEKKRIEAYIKKRTNGVERLKDALDSSLKLREMSELDFGVDGRISYRTSHPLVIKEGTKVAKKWLRPGSPDKTAMKKHIQSGGKIRGVYIDDVDNIQIK